jgi:hypothetical protein
VKKPCKLCHEREATVPDRYSGVGRPRKEICGECHAKRLATDMANVLYQATKRLAKGDR